LNYHIIRSALYNENPNFDQDKMEQQLDQIWQRVSQVNSSYSKFKGEFIAVSEPVINKDLLAMKFDRIVKYQDK
jgi:hypothetical protein